MKLRVLLVIICLSDVGFLLAQNPKIDTTYSEVEKKFIRDYGYNRGIVGHNEKYIITLNLETFATSHIDLLSLNFYDRNTLKFIKDLKVFGLAPNADNKEIKFINSMRLKTIFPSDGKLFIFTQRTYKEKKNKQEILYCTIVDENFTVKHYLKEIISVPYVNKDYGNIEIIKSNESAKQILVIAQPETERDKTVYIDTKLLNFQLNVLSQGIIDLPFKSVHQTDRELVPIDYYFRDNQIYSFTNVTQEDDEEDKRIASPDFIRTIAISDLDSKKTVVVPLEFKGKLIYNIGMFYQNNEMKVSGFYQNIPDKKKLPEKSLNGIFTSVINNRTGLIEKTAFSEFTPRQIADLAEANNLEEKKNQKEKDIKAERVNGWLNITDAVISDDNFVLISEYRRDYTETIQMGKSMTMAYNITKRGSVCLFSFNNEGELQNCKTFNRYLSYRVESAAGNVIDVFNMNSLHVFDNNNNQLFNLKCDANGSNYILTVNMNTLEFQSDKIEDKALNAPKCLIYYKEESYIVDDQCYFTKSCIASHSGKGRPFSAKDYDQFFLIGKIENR